MEAREEIVDWEQFRTDAHKLIDWIVNYRKNLETHAVVPSVGPNDIYNSLPPNPPTGPPSFPPSFPSSRPLPHADAREKPHTKSPRRSIR